MHHCLPLVAGLVVFLSILFAASSSGSPRTVVYRSRKVITQESTEDEV